jgi:hypothetical protein
MVGTPIEAKREVMLMIDPPVSCMVRADDSESVDFEDFSDLLIGNQQKVSRVIDRGVVDQHVESTKARNCCGGEGIA